MLIDCLKESQNLLVPLCQLITFLSRGSEGMGAKYGLGAKTRYQSCHANFHIRATNRIPGRSSCRCNVDMWASTESSWCRFAILESGKISSFYYRTPPSTQQFVCLVTFQIHTKPQSRPVRRKPPFLSYLEIYRQIVTCFVGYSIDELCLAIY